MLPAALVPDPELEVELDPGLAPLMLELHASSSPPPPTTAAPAPAARSRLRRLSASRGDDPPRPPRFSFWGDPSPQTPLGRDPSPQTPLALVGLALDGVPPGCAVWSLMCNRSPFEVAPRRGTASEVTPCDPGGAGLRVLRRQEANIT